jgi:hypothetical protein
MHPPPIAALALGAALLHPMSAGAQPHDAAHAPAAAVAWGLGAQAVGVVTRAAPALDGRALTEGYLTQPAMMAHLGTAGGRLALVGTVNLEGATLQRGELNTGIYGEGYVDRRHPHTYLHELVASAALSRGGARASLSAGKGFAPFGTDDPMMRPFVKYPVNHHLAQILERAVVIAAARGGPLLVEAGAFNGDEPVTAGAPPRWRRFGDSWSARATLIPRPGVELQASGARVASPELAAGGGTDQRKASVSARVERRPAAPGLARYALVEWARTGEYSAGRRSFAFGSWLAEGSLAWRGAQLAARAERTGRPEEERLADPFRAARPHTDASIIGSTRFEIGTLSFSRPFTVCRAAGLRLAPLVEASLARATQLRRPSAFDPALFYGGRRLWNLSAGVAVAAGMPRAAHRMGRYGVARVAAAGAGDGGHSACASTGERHRP